MRQMISKAEQLEAKQRYRSFKERLKKDVLESRRKLLNVVRNLPPGIEPKVKVFFRLDCLFYCSFPGGKAVMFTMSDGSVGS